MTVAQLVEELGLEVLTGNTSMDREVKSGYTSDLLSDAIAGITDDAVWITIQRHINVLGVAKLKNIAAIITPRNLKVETEVVERAKTEGIALLRTGHTAFEISGQLYGLLRQG